MASKLPWWTAIPRPLRRRAPRLLKRVAILTAYGSASWRHPGYALSYILFGRELDNFTYEIGNLGELASFVASVVGGTSGDAAASIAELEEDTAFRRELEVRLRLRYGPSALIAFGRRAGWYALVRKLKPHYVIETGVRDGLGSAVLLQALSRNASDGVDGRLASVDIDPSAGWLVPDRLHVRWNLVIDDSIKFLSRLDYPEVDLFIHDSDHRYSHEWSEFAAVGQRLGSDALLVSDNSHAMPTLLDYSAHTGRPFRFWRERPLKHWYPGGGIGISTNKMRS